MRTLLVFFMLLWALQPLNLLAEAADNQNLLPSSGKSTAGLCSTIVNSSVNVITGQFIDNAIDLTLPGPEPLTVSRTHCSGDEELTVLYKGWHLNHPTKLELDANTPRRTDSAKKKARNQIGVDITDAWGGALRYRTTTSMRRAYREGTCILKPQYPSGYVNCSGGDIGAHTWLYNHELELDLTHRKCELKDGAGDIRTYGHFHETGGDDNSLCGTMSLVYHRKASGFRFEYTYDKHKELNCVTAFSLGHRPYASFTIHPKTDKFKTFRINSSDGRQVTYHAKKFTFVVDDRQTIYDPAVASVPMKVNTTVNLYYLDRVDSPEHPTHYYKYSFRSIDKTLHVTTKEWDNPDHYIHNEYYTWGVNNLGLQGKIDLGEYPSRGEAGDFRIDRVRTQKAPVGVDATPVVTHQYLYYQHPDGGGSTDVFDAYQNKTSYYYDAKRRLNRTARWNQVGHVCHNESYTWSDAGRLLAKIDTDGLDHVWIARAFEYDSAGNIIRETTFGDLTGQANGRARIDEKGLPHKGAAESYSHWFRYDDTSAHNLVAEGQEDGPEIRYVCNSTPKRLEASYLMDAGRCVWREFHKYDSHGLCTADITDDGSGDADSDLTDVTVRHILRRYFSPTGKNYGSPLSTEELYLDLATGQEVLLRRYCYKYDHRSKMTHCEVYDADRNLCHTLEYRYDRYDNVARQNDADGNIIRRSYDCFGHLLEEYLPDGRHLKYCYDLAGRMISVEERGSDGLCQITYHHYDWLGHRIATIDPKGNETRFSYDAFDRLIKQRQIPVDNGSGQIVAPTTRWKYDTLGRPITTTDPAGRITRQRYTARGQLAEKINPDGSIEQRHYHPNGRLAAVVCPDGITIRYSYDVFGNITQQEEYAPDGTLLKNQQWQWRDKRLLAYIDALGCLTTYSYDGAGRRIAEQCGDRLITYRYDSRGRRVEESCLDPLHPSGSIVKAWVYDQLDRVLEESTSDSYGNLQHRMAYTYDKAGRCIRTANWVTTLQGLQEAITTTTYDSLGRITSITDPQGNTTYTSYAIVSYATGGHTVTTTTIDPLGRRSVQLEDPLGRTVSTELFDPFGTLLSRHSYTYDLAGQRLTATATVVAKGQIVGAQLTKWHYDSGGRVLKETYGVGTPEQYSLNHTYNAYGWRISTQKADGVLLSWEYDVKGRPIAITSSSQDLSYRYAYDAADHIISTQDMIHQEHIYRTYDIQGNLVQEQLGDGLTISYSYDVLARPLSLTYPDGSSVSYSYTGEQLKTITRLASDGSESYQHSYLTYDQAGRPLSAALAGAAGAASWCYDSCGRLLQIEAPHYQLKIEDSQYNAVGNLLGCTLTDPSGTVNASWGYDASNQVITEEGCAAHSYDYESLGNRLSVDGVAWRHGSHNRLLQAGDKQLRYDLNGNLVDDGVRQYRYDALDRLIGIDADTATTSYRYDVFHRRLAREHRRQDEDGNTLASTSERFLYVGLDEVGSINAAGDIYQLRILGKGLGAEIGASVAMEFDGIPYVPLYDYSGSVRALIAASDGSCAAHYRYDAFGNTTLATGPLAELCHWRFSSKRLDHESGLIYFGRRYYEPSLGRWITLDPAGYDAGANGYLYVKNAPCTHCDLYGLYERPINGLRPGADGNNGKRFNDTPYSVHSSTTFSCDPNRNPIGGFINWIGCMISAFSYHFLPVPFLRDVVGLCGHFLQGKCLCSFRPHWREYASSWGYVGTERNHPQACIMFTTGMLNSIDDAKASGAAISKMYGNERVMVVHNSSWGILADFCEYIAQKFNISTHSTHVQHTAFQIALARHDIVIAYAHSQGAQIDKNALQLLTPEQRSRIHVRTFGPAAIIEPKNLASAVNYVSNRDPIPFLADTPNMVSAFYHGHDHVRILHSNCSLPTDHSFRDNTYKKALSQTAKYFLGNVL